MVPASMIILVLLYSGRETKGQTPELIISPIPAELGSNITMTCKAAIDTSIFFHFNGVQKGTCQAPFAGIPGACLPSDILQNITIGETTWIISPASLSNEGNWTCRRQLIDSTVTFLDIFKCPDTIISESGISADVNINDTSTVNITISIDCLYPSTNPEILLQLKSGDNLAGSTTMNCKTIGTSCSTGSAYECSKQISVEMASIGHIQFDTEYSLFVAATPLVGAECDRLAVFSTATLGFMKTGSTSLQSGSDLKWWEWLLIIIGCVFGIMIILYVNYRCSNKNCKTHAMCWKCSGICHSDYPLDTRNSSEEWTVEHYCCCINHCFPIEGCNTKFCSCFLCCGCCLIEFPAKRIKENGRPLTRNSQSSSIEKQENNTKRKKKKKKAKHSVKDIKDEHNPPVEKHTKEEKAVHTTTLNNTKSEPNPLRDSPAEDKQVNNTKNVEITHSSTPRPLPVLPPIVKNTS